LSDLHIITATAADAPKGTKLKFESSGKLKNKTLVAASKGTTVFVGNLFKTLPVRRRELERNIKRDYSKMLGYLQAYASICVGVKFSVSNQPAKGCVFSQTLACSES
jgi:DNA mismatch repair protein PMS2